MDDVYPLPTFYIYICTIERSQIPPTYDTKNDVTTRITLVRLEQIIDFVIPINLSENHSRLFFR